MDLKLCGYLKTSGGRCGSPAIRGQEFCFYHARLAHSMPMTLMFQEENLNMPPGGIPVASFEMPFLDDAAAIQIGFMQLIHGVAHFRLERWRARTILLALLGASANLKELDKAVAEGGKHWQELVEQAQAAQAQAPKKEPETVTDGKAKAKPRRAG